MYFKEDENFARQLQIELHAYEKFEREKENTKKKENLNLIDSKLEYMDPTPSIHDLFVIFDKKFFWNTLGMVQVLWSNKMTKCAGMCSFEGGRGLCKISLSAPLLSLRPRKDLVETLLHEMIHAYLFVTHNYKDREDHGPEFHKHMFRINKIAGTNITVYHTFYDEVEYYQRHIWRCNGPCQKKKPYFGFVRRAINRPPGPYDNWWNQHQRECPGAFIKISEPDAKSKKTRKTKVIKPSDKNMSIRDFFTKARGSDTEAKNQNKCEPSNIKTLSDFKNNKLCEVKTNGSTSTLIITNTDKGKKTEVLTRETTKLENKIQNAGNSVTANSLSEILGDVDQSRNSKECCQKDLEIDKVKETVRSIWANKFPSFKSVQKNIQDEPNPKKVKLECPVHEKAFSREEIQIHVKDCLDNKGSSAKEKENLKLQASNVKTTDEIKKCPVCSEDIFQSEMNDHLENCLCCSFKNESDSDFSDEIVCESVPCPCCYKWFQASEMNVHIDECLTLNILKEEILAS